MTRIRRFFSPAPTLFMILCLALTMTAVWPARSASAAPPDQPQPTFDIDEVKVGMKGYGKTVFHGTKIEPFHVEVVSINANETPNRSVIWVRCTDERMIKTGPVQGMSGSPIYLWEEGQEQKLGEGGRLIGAFAFGYANTNECIVGVQPIQYMRAVGDRATAKDRPKLSRRAQPGAGHAMLSRLYEASERADVSPLTRSRLGAMRKLSEAATPKGTLPGAGVLTDHAGREPMLGLPGGAGVAGQPMRMMVPMAVGDAGVAEVLAPVLTPMGIQPFAADPSALGGKVPAGFDVENVELEPGSALVVPFAWGDADLSGAGTVTDVLPDGTVLGFGHAMDGVGVTAMPMATGYVHFIVSLNTISYKRAGTLELKGALVQDEQAAVAGTDERPYTSAPVNVTINIEGQPKYSYDYHVLNHPQLTPAIAAAVVTQSATAVQGPPLRNTVRYSTDLKFSTGHELTIQSASVGDGAQSAAMSIASVVGSLTQNTFEDVELESVNTTIDIDYGLDVQQLFSAKLSKTTAAPGETIDLELELVGYHEQIRRKTVPITIPEDMPEGQTQLMVADASGYTQMLLNAKPHLSQIDSVDDYVAGLKAVLEPRPTSLFAMLQTRKVNLAVDGQDYQDLPTSRAVLIGAGNPRAQGYQAIDTQEHDLGRMFMGQAQLQLNIQRDLGSR